MPDEMAEVEEMMVTTKLSKVEKEAIIKDTAQTVNNGSLKDIDFSSLSLSQEIAKEQQSKPVNKNDIASTKKEYPQEINLESLPLSQEIGKGQQPKSLNKSEVPTSKVELPKEIDVNSLPLTQDIRKEYSNNITLPKSADNKVVNAEKNQEEEEIVTWNKQNSTKNKPYSVEVTEREENKNFLKHIVKKGETLFRIAVNYNVEVSELWVWNNLTSTIVDTGTVLKIKR